MFCSDQTAERRERANAANSNFRRQLNRHTQVKAGEGGNEFLMLLNTGWLCEAVAFANEPSQIWDIFITTGGRLKTQSSPSGSSPGG